MQKHVGSLILPVELHMVGSMTMQLARGNHYQESSTLLIQPTAPTYTPKPTLPPPTAQPRQNVDISQATFSYAFSWMKIVYFGKNLIEVFSSGFNQQ